MAVLALLYAVATLAARTLPLMNNIMLLAAVSAPYAVVLAAVALVLSVLGHRVVMSVIAVVVLAVSLGVQIRWYYTGQPQPATGEHVELRVLSANLREGRADMKSFTNLARSSADVITVSELTPDWVRRFNDAGMRNDFPFSVSVPLPGAAGYGLWSRYPLEMVAPLKGGSMVAARVDVAGVQVDPIVASVHVMNPLTFYGRAFDGWLAGITAAKDRMEGLSAEAGEGAVIAAGDFNSTPDMRQFRQLLKNGYRDAVAQTGSGIGPTYPSYPWVPPLITIDHLLTRNALVSSIKTISLRTTDHRALLATIQIKQEKPPYRGKGLQSPS